MIATHILARWVIGIAAALAHALPLRAEDHDRWYVLQMQGKRAGWMHERQVTKDGRITTSSEMQMKLRRGRAVVDIALESEFIETVEGKPVRGKNSMNMATGPIVSEYVFKDQEVEAASGSGDNRVVQMVPLPEGSWLTPVAAAEYVAKRLEAGANEITVRAIDISAGLRAVTSTHKVLERTTVEAMGKVVPAVKWTSTSDIQPGIAATSFVDERGVVIRTDIDLGGLTMTMVLADRELAQSDLEAPELMASTLVEPKGLVNDARNMKRATYLLSVPDGTLADLYAGGPQTFERVDERRIRLTVDLHDVAPAPPDDQAKPEYRGSSQMINSGDEVVARLTRDALDGIDADDHDARVEALRRAVYKHIKNKNFGVGFASAAEVARTCTGDCSEHGVLLAAMLRNAGYPARVASGLVYVDEFAAKTGVFGYHMWTQVLLERDGALRWVDLDATVPGGRGFGPDGFDATHIAISTTSLADTETVNGLVALAPLLGRLNIAIE